MKLPDPYLYYAEGETYTVDAVREIFADDSGLEKLYSEAQVKDMLEETEENFSDGMLIGHLSAADQSKKRYEPVLRHALEALEGYALWEAPDDPAKPTSDAIAAIGKLLG